MTEYRDWQIILTFSVPRGDTEGVLTEALFEASLREAPSSAHGMVASADTAEGKVRIVFTLVNASYELAGEIAKEMQVRVGDAVFSGDDARVSAL